MEPAHLNGACCGCVVPKALLHGVGFFVRVFMCVVYCVLQATPFGAAAEERAVVKRQRRMTPTPDPDSENAASPQVQTLPFPHDCIMPVMQWRRACKLAFHSAGMHAWVRRVCLGWCMF